MSTLRTFNLQNPDSGTVNIEMDQGGNTLMTGITTVRGAAHFTSTSGSDAVGIGTDITAYKLDVRVTGAETGLRVYNPDTSSNASGMIRLGNDDNQNSAFLRLNGSNNTSAVGGAANLVLGTGTAREVHLATNGTSRLRIHADGEVECKGGGAGQNALLVTGNYSSGNNVDIQTWQRTGGAVQAKLIYKDADTSMFFGTDTAHSLAIMTGGTEKLRITSGGQLNFGGNLTQTGFTASITRNSSETDILRIKGNGGNAFIRFEDNDASSSFTLGADDAVGSGGFALYDRSDSAYRVVVDTVGRVSINATSPAPLDGQTPYLYVASGYTNLDGLRIRGLDTGNTLWKTGGDMSLSVASNDAINLKTNGTTRFVLNANSNNSTTLSIGNGSNLTNNTSPDRTSVKVGGTLHLESSFQGSNHKTGMYYNCYASGQSNFYQGTFGASAQDYRAAAATLNHGAFKVYTDPTTSTNYSAGAQITTMKETLRCANGFVTEPNQPAFSVRRNGNQTIAHQTNTKVQWNTEIFDVGGNFDSSTNYRFTAPVAGKYLFLGHLYVYSTYQVEAKIYKNGSIYKRFSGPLGTGSNDNPNGADFMDIIDLSVNDFIEIFALQARTGDSSNVAIYGGNEKETSFVGYLLG